MLLLPGKHEIVVRQAWYQDYVEQALLEPGEIHTIKLAMAKESHVATAGATSELKIDATPPRAAVFVDEQFVGDRKSTRLNSSHSQNSYAVFCFKKKKKETQR